MPQIIGRPQRRMKAAGPATAQSSGEDIMRSMIAWGAVVVAAGLWVSAAPACELSPAAANTLTTTTTAAEAQPPSLAGTSGFALAKNRTATLNFSAGGNNPSLSLAAPGIDQTTAARHDETLLQK
jgi:hypothetical protein